MVRKGPEELKMEAGYPFAPPPAILLDVCGWIAGAGAGGVCGCIIRTYPKIPEID